MMSEKDKIRRDMDMRSITIARKNYGSSITAIANGTGLSRGHLSRIFNNKGTASKDTIIKLKKFFKLRPYVYDDNNGVEKWT